MAAFNGGVLSGATVVNQVQALEARRQAERPAAAPRPSVATPEDFAALDPDRRRAVVAALVERPWSSPWPSGRGHRGRPTTGDRARS